MQGTNQKKVKYDYFEGGTPVKLRYYGKKEEKGARNACCSHGQWKLRHSALSLFNAGPRFFGLLFPAIGCARSQPLQFFEIIPLLVCAGRLCATWPIPSVLYHVLPGSTIPIGAGVFFLSFRDVYWWGHQRRAVNPPLLAGFGLADRC